VRQVVAILLSGKQIFTYNLGLRYNYIKSRKMNHVFILKYIIVNFYSSIYMYFIVSRKSDFGWILIDLFVYFYVIILWQSICDTLKINNFFFFNTMKSVGKGKLIIDYYP
jgi:hypothetical protein